MSSSHPSRSYILLLAVMILFICIIVFKDLLIFNKFLLHKKDDTFIAYWPNYHFMAEKIKDGDFSGWSHKIGPGANIFSYIGRCFDPFFLISLLIPPQFLPHSFVYVIILKFILSGIFFYLYLSTFKLSHYAKLVGGLLYAFNGYMVVWGQHFQFATLMVLAPLLLYSFEMWLLKNKWIPFFIMNTVFIIFNFYYMFILIIYLIIYSIFRYIETHEFKIKNFFVFWLKSSGIGLLAFGTACIFLLPRLSVVFQSTRGGVLHQTESSLLSLNSLSYYVTLIFKFFSSDILKVEEYFGYLNYSNSPHVYTGLITLLLIPHLLYYFKRKDKKLYLFFILIMLTLLIFPFFSYAVHGFEADKYRWTFIVILFQVYLAARIIDLILKNRNLSKKLLAGTFGFLILLLSTGYFLGAKLLSWKAEEIKFVTLKIIAIVLFLIIYGVILLSFNQKNQKILKTVLIFLICFELGFSVYNNFVNYRILVTKEDMETNKRYYFDDTLQAIKFIEKNENSENFYRVHKNYISGYYNDSLIQGFNGISVYSAFINHNLVRFIKSMGILKKKKIKVLKDFNSRLYLETLCSVKYLLTRQRDIIPFGYKSLGSTGDVHIFRNNYHLPLGVIYDAYYPLNLFERLSPAQKDAIMLGAAVLEETGPVETRMRKYTPPSLKIQEPVTAKNFNVRYIKTGNGHEQAVIEIPLPPMNSSPGLKHISLELSLANGCQSFGTLDVLDSSGRIYTNVKQVPVYHKRRHYNLSLAHIEDIAAMRLRLEKSKNIKIYRLQLNLKSFSNDERQYYTSSVDKLRKNPLRITFLEDDCIKGKVTVDNPGILFLSIPYDKGWQLKVDGKKRRPQRVNIGFMGTFLDKGYHEIELEYIPPFFRLGLMITLVSVLLFILLIIFDRRGKTWKAKNEQ